MMKKALIPVLALAAAAVAVPAAAQSYDRWQSISQRKHQLDRRIDNGLRNGALSRREAGRLKTELNSLVRLERSYLRGGLTRWERTDLDRRYDRLAVQVRMERRDRDDRRY
jgi:hypothetical protein